MSAIIGGKDSDIQYQENSELNVFYVGVYETKLIFVQGGVSFYTFVS